MAQMAQGRNKKVKVVQIIARMNVGGPAVIVADLMRSIDSSKVEQELITGYCDSDEADYLVDRFQWSQMFVPFSHLLQ
jgi:CHASE2 domain-containing sensor protein